MTEISDEALDRAVQTLSDPAAFSDAQALVMRAAPGLQRVLASALESGGYFGGAQTQVIEDALAAEDPLGAVRLLLAEETRLGMFVGVAVGIALAGQLELAPEGDH